MDNTFLKMDKNVFTSNPTWPGYSDQHEKCPLLTFDLSFLSCHLCKLIVILDLTLKLTTSLNKISFFLQNGPSQFVSTQVPLPQEKHEEPVHTESEQTHNEHSDSDAEYDLLDLPEVPSLSVHPSSALETVSRPEMLPFPPSALSDLNNESENTLEKSATNETEEKQFLPFISPPSATISVKESCPSPRSKVSVNDDSRTTIVKESSPLSRTRTGIKDDLQDVLVAAQAAAESAERAAAAARAAASLAQVRITELVNKQNEYESTENPFSGGDFEPDTPVKSNLDSKGSLSPVQSLTSHQPQRLQSMEDGFMSYPNLFSSRSPGELSRDQSFADNSRSSDEH